jgi:hypothetical protein
MFIGIGGSIPQIADLPGPSRPGGGGGGAFEYTAIDNSFSMKFDGTAFMQVGGNIFNGFTAVAVSMWVNPSLQGIYDAPLNYYSFANGGNNKIGFSYVSSTNNYFRFTLQAHPTLSYVESSTNSIPLNQWTHVVGVGEVGQALKIYINGSEDSATQSGTMPTLYQDADLFIGKDNGAAGREFNGKIDEIGIFSTTLSDETIEAIYDTTANNPGKVADLSETPEGVPAAWYRMGD